MKTKFNGYAPPSLDQLTNQSQIAALTHAIFICVSRTNGVKRSKDYIAACDDIKLRLEASIERLKMGEDILSVASCIDDGADHPTNCCCSLCQDNEEAHY